jgi:hypothetical protein
VALAHHIHHGCGGQRFHRPALPFAILDKMAQQEANDLMRRQELAITHHAANAISIAIGDQAEIRPLALEFALTVNVIPFNGFGVKPAKIGIMVRVKCADGALCALKYLIETTGTHTEQRFMSKMKFGFLDQIKID